MAYSNFRNEYLGNFESMASPYGRNKHVNSYTFQTGMVLSIEETISQLPIKSGYAWWDEVETFQNRIVRFENVPGSIYEGVRYDDVEKIKQMWRSMFSEVHGDIIISGTLYSFDGVPKRINGRLDISQTNGMTSLHDIDKHFEYITERLVLPNSISADILGVLKIKGLKGISFHDDFKELYDATKFANQPYLPDGAFTINNIARTVINLAKIKEIVNKHLETDKNLLECQEELMDNNYKHYARL